jgi:transposase, IS30 family
VARIHILSATRFLGAEGAAILTKTSTAKKRSYVMTYRQLSPEERYMLAALRRQGYNQSQIARALGRHRSTVGRELRRNSTKADGRYRAFTAQERANGRRSRSRRNRRFTVEDFALVDELLCRQWSPEQVAGYLRREGRLSISHETIYRHVWRDKKRGGLLHTHLRGARKKRRKRYGAYDSRGRLAGKRMISERPPEVESRASVGHWEADTVAGAGAKDCVLTLVERKTGLVLVGKLSNRTAGGLSRRAVRLIRGSGARFETVTADNGTEFHDYGRIERLTGAVFYFARPYHSWERGSNENANGLLRQYLPKGASLAGLSQQQCNAIARKLNTRPRKRLGFRTPLECFDES